MFRARVATESRVNERIEGEVGDFMVDRSCNFSLFSFFKGTCGLHRRCKMDRITRVEYQISPFFFFFKGIMGFHVAKKWIEWFFFLSLSTSQPSLESDGDGISNYFFL